MSLKKSDETLERREAVLRTQMLNQAFRKKSQRQKQKRNGHIQETQTLI